MKTKRFALVLGVVLLLLVPTGVALAAPPFDTVVTSGETVKNDVLVMDGDITVEEGATVNGNVLAFNGNAFIAGTIKGDLVLFNGNMDAASTAVITGDCVLLNGTLTDATDPGLNCTEVESLPNFISDLSSLGRLRFGFEPSLTNRSEIGVKTSSAATHFFANLAAAAGRGLALGLLAFVAASLLPRHLTRVEDVVRRKPVASGAVGLLTAVAVPSLVALLLPVSIILTLVCIGLLGFPIMFALLIGLVAGALLGWITIGNMLGEWLADPLKLKNRTLPITAALGTAILTFVVGLMGFGEGLITILVISVGLGATALTRFGTVPYLAAGPDNAAKLTSVLETLPVEEAAELKGNND